MKIFRFPKTIKIELEEHERHALEAILKEHPQYRDDRQLIRHVVAEGITALLGREYDHHDAARELTPAERMDRRLRDMASDGLDLPPMTTDAGLRPFPSVTQRYKDPNREHVESYVATVIPRRLQERLQLFLDTNPETDLESLLATLIGVGLDRVEDDPKILKPDPAEEFAEMEGSSPLVTASAADEEFTLDFPRTIRLDLDDKLRSDLRDLANVQAHSTDKDLVRDVLARGLEAMKDDGVFEPFARSAGIKRARHKEHGADVSLEDRLRKKLTKFLADHPDAMKMEHARKLLADLGARRG